MILTTPSTSLDLSTRAVPREAGYTLSSELVAGVASPQFDRPCEAQFEWLASNNPTGLIRLCLSGLDDEPALLSQAAEYLGRTKIGELSIPVLLQLLRHHEALVREGAVYGLAPFLETSLQAREALRELAENDLSPGVRGAAADALLLLEQ